MENNFGFIVTSHVNSEQTNWYWIECYKCIRNFYDNEIVIIQDNCNFDYFKIPEDLDLKNVRFIISEYPARGELLPYYYLYKEQMFPVAVIIHDSLFIQQKIEFGNIETVKFFWHIESYKKENINKEREIMSIFEKDDLLNYYNSDNWKGCFGIQSIINLKFLNTIQEKYNFFKLLDVINTRILRCCFERVFGVICCYEDKNLTNNSSIYGYIITDMFRWEDNEYKTYTFNQYICNKDKINRPLIKCFSGR